MNLNCKISVGIYRFLLYFCELFCGSVNAAHRNEIKDSKI